MAERVLYREATHQEWWPSEGMQAGHVDLRQGSQTRWIPRPSLLSPSDFLLIFPTGQARLEARGPENPLMLPIQVSLPGTKQGGEVQRVDLDYPAWRKILQNDELTEGADYQPASPLKHSLLWIPSMPLSLPSTSTPCTCN